MRFVNDVQICLRHEFYIFIIPCYLKVHFAQSNSYIYSIYNYKVTFYFFISYNMRVSQKLLSTLHPCFFSFQNLVKIKEKEFITTIKT